MKPVHAIRNFVTSATPTAGETEHVPPKGMLVTVRPECQTQVDKSNIQMKEANENISVHIAIEETIEHIADS